MRLRQLVVNPYQENTYLLCASNGEAWVIDPGMHTAQEYRVFERLLAEEGARLTGMYLTHAHIDHVLGVAWVAQKYKVPLFYHAAEEVVYDHAAEYATLMGLNYVPGPRADAYLEEGQELTLGDARVKVLFVPGHSPGHVAFYLPELQWLFSGDVLFRGSIGNYELPLASYDTLMRSLREKVLPLGDAVQVWPGHGESTTIGVEKRSNPFLYAL